MPTRLSKLSIGRAIDHLVAFGDTDVFPHLIEIAFLSARRDKIIDEILKLDLDLFQPAQAIETIAPKSRLGFRIVHQLPILETILFTAAVVEIGADLEKLKRPIDEFGPFAYRFSPKAGSSLFLEDHSYRDWLEWQRAFVAKNHFTHVVLTDIADFYQRIYFHRIENILDVATTKKGINAFIKTLIKQIRSRQSYGIPVGGSASRLLAEAVLSDADSALADEGFLFTRFVDDYRLFLDSNQSPYSALAFLAEQLATSEGLSLNAQKTKLLKIDDFNEFLSSQLVDVSDEAEQSALYQLNHALYFDEEPSQEDIEKLKALNLLDLLKEELSEEMWDFGKIRAIFLGLRLTEDENAADFIVTRLDDLIPFIKEVVLLLHELPRRARFLSEALREAIIAQLKAGPASSVPTIRVWLMELFLRECLEIDHRGLVEIAKDETLSNRHSLIIRKRVGDPT